MTGGGELFVQTNTPHCAAGSPKSASIMAVCSCAVASLATPSPWGSQLQCPQSSVSHKMFCFWGWVEEGSSCNNKLVEKYVVAGLCKTTPTAIV